MSAISREKSEIVQDKVFLLSLTEAKDFYPADTISPVKHGIRPAIWINPKTSSEKEVFDKMARARGLRIVETSAVEI